MDRYERPPRFFSTPPPAANPLSSSQCLRGPRPTSPNCQASAKAPKRSPFNGLAQAYLDRRRSGSLMEFDGNQMRCIAVVGRIDILNLCRPVIQVGKGFEFVAGPEVEGSELNL